MSECGRLVYFGIIALVLKLAQTDTLPRKAG
jgi:hypothetical protein